MSTVFNHLKTSLEKSMVEGAPMFLAITSLYQVRVPFIYTASVTSESILGPKAPPVAISLILSTYTGNLPSLLPVGRIEQYLQYIYFSLYGLSIGIAGGGHGREFALLSLNLVLPSELSN